MSSKTKLIALSSIFIAIVLLQNMIPILGGLNIGVLRITLIHVTVAISAIVLGPKIGTMIGLTWGLTSFITALTAPSSPVAALIFTNPVIALVPRLLVGLIAGLVFNKLAQRLSPVVSAGITGFLTALLNTIMVLGLAYVFYANGMSAIYKVSVDQLLPILLGIVASNGIPEAIAATILVPLIALPLRRLVQQHQ